MYYTMEDTASEYEVPKPNDSEPKTGVVPTTYDRRYGTLRRRWVFGVARGRQRELRSNGVAQPNSGQERPAQATLVNRVTTRT